ncbi:PAS domain S-box protein [Aliifodinibius sp. S!AR15-10]|uniref:PAS domain S-box protein n=1 Tax=Aliifodinibius sp. S!AR15-10 TaxID=2950437 RepID=UPI002861CAB7|nr:PAS domain S-box protein [Aliifodinibius sp. S!AR15-10]MDR8390441.1 PAS domain S-box protein [Aliifodinibius sp. S!AR15-10]
MDWESVSEDLFEGFTSKVKLLNQIFESFPEIIILENTDRSILAVNDSVESMLGYSPSELVGVPVKELYANESAYEKMGRAVMSAGAGKSQTLETKFLKKNGDSLPIETLVKKIVDTTGNHVGFQAVVRDVSERKKREKIIKKFFSLPLNFMTTATPDGYLKEFNPHFQQLLGYTEEELLSMPFTELIHPEDIERTMQEVGKLASGEIKMMVRFENRVIAKDGTEYWISWAATFDDETGLMYSMGQDVTKHKVLENQLIESKEKAEEANRAKSQFIANMSHEIRTPMNAILGFADMLKEQVDSNLETEYVQNIYNSGQSLLKLINDVLDLSKIEAGKQQLNIRPVNVRRVVDEVQSIFALRSEEKGVTIRTEIDDSTPNSILLDELKLRQILVNLVGNALKFTQEGFVEVGVRSREIESIESQVNLEVYVKDTGKGITKERQQAIFSEFEQEDYSISDKFGGTGLGLAISLRLAHLMNGSINVESEPGKGSIFTLIIPNLAIASMNEEMENDVLIDYNIDLKKGRILIVDDIQLNRDLVKDFLREYPLDVLEASNGVEAVRLAEEQSLDLIFMDIKMAHMDGVEAMKQIKKKKKTLPIVALTASAFTTHNKELEGYGFDGYLRKPVSRSQILMQLARFVGTDENNSIEESNDDRQKKSPEINGVNIKGGKIVKKLNSDITPIISELDTDAIMMDHYKDLLKAMKEVEKEVPAQEIVRFNSQLETAIQLFDIEQIRKLVTIKYPELIETLEG